jgi:Glycosyl transferase family 2
VRASLTTSSNQPPLFRDLQEALAGALAQAGVACGVSVDCCAAHEDDLVHVLVPGGYMPYVHPAAHPSPDQVRRTVLVVTESPGEPGFDRATALAENAAATFVLDPAAAPELARVGVAARPLRLGHVPAWEAAKPAERDIDLAVVADHTDRRALAIAQVAPALAGRRAALHLARHPLTEESARATPTGAEKRALLARTRVLLCVHGGETRGFDWLAAMPAIANGCVVLTELPTGHGPLVAGRHFECADFHALPAAVGGLLASPDRVDSVARDAYELLRTERPLSALGDALREAIEEVQPARAGARSRLALPMPIAPPAPTPAVERLQQAQGDTVRAALKQTLLRQRRLERELRAQENGAPREDRVVEFGRDDGSAAAPRVSAVVTLYNYAHTIADALRSVALSDIDDVELVLVDDASTDESLAVARAALDELPWLRGRIVERGSNGGLARARNLGLEHARADYAFVLDADNTVRRSGLRRLADALDEHPDAHFAYGVIRMVGPAGPLGLTSWAPWDPWWLRIDNYIDAMAMVRRESVLDLGGYTSEEALYGWEDFELWCKMASRGMSGTFVPELVADYSAGGQSMISLTTLDSTDGWTALLDRYEFLRQPA